MNQEAAWRRCSTDGRFEIDHGEVERQIRRVALGRKLPVRGLGQGR
ncbi:transposase [Sorangium sp. So ce1151]